MVFVNVWYIIQISRNSKSTCISKSKEFLLFVSFQGDVELALGWNPIPLFNRANFPELASMQVIRNAFKIVFLN